MTKATDDPRRTWGARAYIQLGLVTVLLLGVGLGGWAATAEISSAVIAPGRFRVEGRRQVVQHPDGGVVGEILVREGDIVEAGDVLIRLDGTALRSELAILESQLYELVARRGRLWAEQSGASEIQFDKDLLAAAEENPEVEELIEGQRRLFAARNATMENELNVLSERQVQIREQITGTESQIRAMVRQAELIEKELVGQRQLFEQGLAQSQRLLSLEREAARLEGQRGELVAEAARLKGQVAEIEIERLRLGTKRREEAITQLRDIGYRELELKEKRVAIREQLDRLEVRAPRAGVVYEMTVFALKSVVRPADPILYIVPTGESLVIDVEVDPLQIDEVFPGQEAVVRMPALNQRLTPQLFATMLRVSPDIHVEEESGRSYYRAEVLLKPGELDRIGGIELSAGMPVEVYIQTGARTALGYLVKPMTDYFSRAWRES